MNNMMKTLTGVSFAGLMMAANLHADEAVLVKPDKKDAVSLKASGRVHFQFGYVDQENDVNSGDWSTFEVRRARIGLKAKFPNDVKAAVEANVKPSDTSVSAATVTWGPSDAFELTGGFDKPAASLEENTSSASILTVERSNVNNNIAAGYDSTGLWANGEIAPFFYQVGVFNGEDIDSSRNSTGEEAEYMFNARGGVELEVAEDTTVLAMVTYLQSDDPNGAMDYEDVTVASLQVEFGAFDIRTEYFIGSEDGDDTTGFYIMPSMKISKELEAVVRYEQAESDASDGIRAQSRYARRTDVVEVGEDTADRGDDFWALYFGVNYYFQKYNKVMLGLEFSELDNTDAGTLESTTLFGAYRVRF